MKQKKLLALGMASVMAISTTCMAVAADATTDPATGDISGGGSIEGFIDKDVFTVTLPTTADVNFKLDPQELLLATGSSATLDTAALTAGYGSKILFEDAGNYLSKSKDITIVNKSTFDVDVTVGAKVTGLTKDGEDGYSIDVVDDSVADFSYGDKTAISLKLTPSDNTVTDTTEGTPVSGDAVYLTGDEAGVTLTNTVAKSDNVEDAYEVTGTTGNYVYSIKADVSAVPFKEVVYNLSGTVNTAADWTNFSKDTASTLSVDITYSVSRHGATVTSNTMTAGSTSVVEYTLAKEVKSVLLASSNGVVKNLALTSTQYTKTATGFTLAPSWTSKFATGAYTFTVTYIDDTTETVTLTVS